MFLFQYVSTLWTLGGRRKIKHEREKKEAFLMYLLPVLSSRLQEATLSTQR